MSSYNPATYDPEARRRRYLENRKLKGRLKSSNISKAKRVPTTPKVGSKPPGKKKDSPAEAKARVARLENKVSTLQGALTETLVKLSEKRQNERKTEKENSDGRTTAKERQSAKEYRDRNKSKIASARKSSSGGSSSSSSASKKSVDAMSVDELQDRVAKIRGAIQSAKKQLSEARRASGSHLSHSAIVESKLTLNIPSKRKESVLMKPADFGGYATRHDVPCADGRTIRPGAFSHNDGAVVPLVYSHSHNDIDNILGHCILEDRPDGVYAHAFFNETERGQTAKQQVQHGDLRYLSIFANNLVEKAKDGLAHAKDVVKGNIREVSLVIAGANPGAIIDNITLAHSDGSFEPDTSEAIIHSGLEIDIEDETDGELQHEESLQDVLDTLNEKQAVAVNYLLSQALTHSEDDDGDESETDVDDDDEGSGEEEDSDNSVQHGDGFIPTAENHNQAGAALQHNDTQEESSMMHNVFDRSSGTEVRPTAALSHDELQSIVREAKKNGSLKDAIEGHLEHSGVMVNGELRHGIENIDYLFPDAQVLENSPAFVSRRMEWVDKVLDSVRKSPFSRIKTITADITPDEARARGYIKGNMKNEEFFALSKRETTPQTVYKKQKLDRDDVIDIVSLDVVAWLKAEMKVMLDEEIAGAILVGDGRSVADDDKIREDKIRPIASDAELYVTTAYLNLDDASSSIEELIDSVIENRRHYKGTGQPTFFTTESVISSFLTVKDNFNRRIYSNLDEVASVLRVKEIVPVEVMERVPDLVGIMVNLSDYTLGADRGGQATMFDDFDIDYNKLRYLIETRLSGALTLPKAALVFRKTAGTSVLVAPEEPAFDGETVTVPTVTGVTYKNAVTDTTLTTASPVELDPEESLTVVAVPASGYHFSTGNTVEWTFTNEG